MKQKYIFIGVALLISLFIYLFYRTEKTVATNIFIQIISYDSFLALKASIVNALPLNNIVVYSLPEGLWVFCITLTSKSYFINIRNWHFDCVFIPLIFCFTLEIFQFFHITNGRFDFMDIWFCIVFWILGILILRDKVEKENILAWSNSKPFVCLASYGIVYLAHVLK
ncbi:MAG: hypothetical protein REI64_11230 [Pedobacter sp.]|uniref:hypothetical protein n=1 Tax=Pedobacter sp. TaxID=1411316 RepID=UPI002807F79E|nr:hypothetical protein [Pedobacter sp.]MDQ8005363.1 hypothetical protein [Pedobacter sp.]